MKYLHEFRDRPRAEALLTQIEQLTARLAPQRPLKIMEICGGHTHAIFKSGLESLLPDALELVHGPGCPVCIMPKGRIDEAIALGQ
ncbi:MAG: hydrogenase formation protein HypD, partial [Microcystaceae cyanobacterium]